MSEAPQRPGSRPIAVGEVVLANLVNPPEKFLGVLLSLDPSGLGLRAVSLVSFESWVREVAGEKPPSLGPATMFVPMHRLERLFRDEDVGEVESYSRRFHGITGHDLEPQLLA